MRPPKSSPPNGPKEVWEEEATFLPDLVMVFPLKSTRKFEPGKLRSFLSDIIVEDDSEDEDEGDYEGTYAALKALIRRDGESTMEEVRVAFLDDVKRYLATQHCRMHTFLSCDDDELFLLVSLGDYEKKAQHDEDATAFAHRRRYKFQTKFTHRNAEKKLRLLQTMRSELDATFLEYNKDVVAQANDMYCPFEVEATGEPDKSTTVFRQYSASIAGKEGSFMRTVDRVRLLFGDFEQFIDLQDCLGGGLIKAYYAVHKASKLEEFRVGQAESRDRYQRGHVAWANFRPLETLMSILPSLGPPIQEIRDYFGEMIGFYFLWLRHTSVSLVFLVPIVTVLFMTIQRLDNFEISFDRAGAPIEEKRGLAVVFLSSAFCLSLWGQFYIKGWRRTESYYRELWGVELAEFSDIRRPDYRGDHKPSPINEHVTTKVYNPWKRRAVFLVALVVTLAFIVIVLLTVMLIYYLYEDLTRLGVSILFSVQIFAYQLVWDILSDKLVELQNPRTDMEARNLDVAVLFPFSVVSAYSNLAVKAVYDDSPREGSCMPDDCTKRMQLSLYQVVLPVFFAQVVSMLKPYVILRFSLWWEARRMIKQGKTVHRSFIEVQAKRPPFGPSQLNSEMNIMAVLIGYVFLFGSVAPGIVVAVTLIFLVKIRIDAFKLCNVYQRVMPARLPPDGIGQWDKVVQTLAEVGRMTCLFIPIFNLAYFNNPGVDEGQDWLLDALGAAPNGLSDLQKAVLWFACKEVLDRIGQLVDFLIPDVSMETKLIRAKRHKVAKRMRNQLATKKGWKGGEDDDEEQPSLELKQNSRTKSTAIDVMSPRTSKLYREADTNTTKHLHDLELWDKVDKNDVGLPFDRKTYFG